MPMLADHLQQAGQLLEQIKQHTASENYQQATVLVNEWQKLLQHIFSQLEPSDKHSLQRVQQLSDSFVALLPALQQEHAKIKHSIGQIATVKSDNKISKTYQID